MSENCIKNCFYNNPIFRKNINVKMGLIFNNANKNYIRVKNFVIGSHIEFCRPRQLSLYSDSLRAGRSGDRIPVSARFSAPVQTCPGANSSSYTMGTVSFPRVKRPGSGADHPPHLRADVMKWQGYTCTHPLALSGLLQGEPPYRILNEISCGQMARRIAEDMSLCIYCIQNRVLIGSAIRQ